MSGSTAAVRARAASATSTAEISRERTRRAVSSAESSQSSGILGPLDLGHHQEAVQGRRRVGEELLARQAGADAILGIVPRFRRRPRPPAPPPLTGGLGPPAASQVLPPRPEARALLAAAGPTPCHLVGGALRDLVLGLPFHDVDAVVAGRGGEIAGLLAASLPARLVLLGGKEFAAFRLVGAELVLDLWDRGEASLAADLARRDFTVNSIAWEPGSGAITDPHAGPPALPRRVRRATTPESFAGAPLRVLRLPRLAVQLPGFAAEPATLGLARRTAGRLSEVAAERGGDRR